jgi:hypothetical protein
LVAFEKRRSQEELRTLFSAGVETLNIDRGTMKDVSDYVLPSGPSPLPLSPATLERIANVDFSDFSQFDGLGDDNFFSFIDELFSDGKSGII